MLTKDSLKRAIARFNPYSNVTDKKKLEALLKPVYGDFDGGGIAGRVVRTAQEDENAARKLLRFLLEPDNQRVVLQFPYSNWGVRSVIINGALHEPDQTRSLLSFLGEEEVRAPLRNASLGAEDLVGKIAELLPQAPEQARELVSFYNEPTVSELIHKYSEMYDGQGLSRILIRSLEGYRAEDPKVARRVAHFVSSPKMEELVTSKSGAYWDNKFSIIPNFMHIASQSMSRARRMLDIVEPAEFVTGRVQQLRELYDGSVQVFDGLMSFLEEKTPEGDDLEKNLAYVTGRNPQLAEQLTDVLSAVPIHVRNYLAFTAGRLLMRDEETALEFVRSIETSLSEPSVQSALASIAKPMKTQDLTGMMVNYVNGSPRVVSYAGSAKNQLEQLVYLSDGDVRAARDVARQIGDRIGSTVHAELALSPKSLEGLDDGDQHLLLLIAHDYVLQGDSPVLIKEKLESYVAPALRILRGIHKDKNVPTVSTSLSLLGYEASDNPLDLFLMGTLRSVRNKNALLKGQTDFDKNALRFETFPSCPLTQALQIEYAIKNGILVPGTHTFTTKVREFVVTYQDYQDSRLLELLAHLEGASRTMIQASDERGEVFSGKPLPLVYMRTFVKSPTGRYVTSPTGGYGKENQVTHSFFADGVLQLLPAYKQEMRDLEAANGNGYEDAARTHFPTYLRQAAYLIMGGSESVEMRKRFESLRSELDAEIEKLEPGRVWKSGPDKRYWSYWPDKATAVVRKLLRNPQADITPLQEIAKRGMYGSPGAGSLIEQPGLFQLAYDDVERIFISHVLRNDFEGAITAVQEAAHNLDYRESAQRLLAHSQRN